MTAGCVALFLISCYYLAAIQQIEQPSESSRTFEDSFMQRGLATSPKQLPRLSRTALKAFNSSMVQTETQRPVVKVYLIFTPQYPGFYDTEYCAKH